MSSDFQEALHTYADLVVRVALNIQRGQRLVVCDPGNWGVSHHNAPLVREIARCAYEAGATFVDTIWGDEKLRLLSFSTASSATFDRLPKWWSDGILEYFQQGDAVLFLIARDPDLLQDQDPSLVSQASTALLSQYKLIHEHRSRNTSNHAAIAAPVPGWATKVFPGVAPQLAEDELWRAIFTACRVVVSDPVSAWQAHARDLDRTAHYLNAKRYKSLKFASQDTDLFVGLPAGHKWCTATESTPQGVAFLSNMPTEEVFTLPHREQVRGIVRSTRPLSFGGVLIQDFTLTFENGRVTSASATRNEDMLTRLLETDEGASRLGEVALVPNSSPISQLELIFHNILYDENAASHLPLGSAWKSCLQDAEELEDQSFESRGGNHSSLHVDFMIGSRTMNVDGLLDNRLAEPLMRDGEWVFNP
jgi:aminopeptidase